MKKVCSFILALVLVIGAAFSVNTTAGIDLTPEQMDEIRQALADSVRWYNLNNLDILHVSVGRIGADISREQMDEMRQALADAVGLEDLEIFHVFIECAEDAEITTCIIAGYALGAAGSNPDFCSAFIRWDFLVCGRGCRSVIKSVQESILSYISHCWIIECPIQRRIKCTRCGREEGFIR